MSAVRFRAALLLLTLSAFGLRTYGLHHQSFWLDEVDAIAMAGAPVADQVRKLSATGENGPLFFLLFKGWLALAGTTEFGARYLSALASTLAVPLVGALAHRLLRHRPAAVLAAALAAASPYYVWYGQDAKMYPLYAALALAAQYCFLRAWEGPPPGRRTTAERPKLALPFALRHFAFPAGWWWAGYVVASSLALYVHLFAALQIGANTLAGCWLWRAYPAGRRGFALATALLIAPYLPLAAWQAPVLLAGADVGYQPASLATIVVALAEQLTWHLNPPPDRRLLIPLAATALWGLWRCRRAPRPAAGVGTGQDSAPAAVPLVLAVWLVAPVAVTWAIQGAVPVFRDRYLIPLLAPLLILLARAVAPPWSPAGFAAGAFVVAGFAYGLSHRPPNPDFRAAAALVRQVAAPGEPVGFLAEYAERPFNFYFHQGPGSYEKVRLPYTNYPGMTELEGQRAVAASLRAGRWLWVVRFEDWLWDGRDLTGQYLAGRGARVVLRRDFNGVSVTRYEFPESGR